MKQRLLTLLLTSGLCILCSSCVSCQYHFVNEWKNWREAQSHCRKYYTDLATIDNQEEMEALIKTASGHSDSIWIGLYDDPTSWQWSLADSHFYSNREIQFTNWGPGQPQSTSGEPCVLIYPDRTWQNYPCNTTAYFICYSGTSQKYSLVQLGKTWGDAQRYCREHHTDLASIRNQNESEELWNATGPQLAWIGLFRHTWMWWSDQRGSTFRRWGDSQPVGENENCGTAHSAGMGRSRCDALKSFVCYSDNLVMVREKKTWDEALSYCRQHYKDLATPSTEQLQFWVKKWAKEASTAHLWMGLRYSCVLHRWLWANGDTFGHQNWAMGKDTGKCGHRGAVESEEGQWVSLLKTERLNFICSKYEGDAQNESTVRQNFRMRVQLRIPSSLDKSDPAVVEAILKQWTKELDDDGITGVNARWGKQQDGQIFHPEVKFKWTEQNEQQCVNPEG